MNLHNISRFGENCAHAHNHAMATGSEKASFPIEKLRGVQDYHNWKFAMKMILVHEDLWECIEPSKADTKPDEKRDMKALAKICLSVHSSAYPHVRNAAGAKAAWNNLKNAYEDRGLSRRLSLLRSLFGTKLEGNMDTYLSTVTELAQQLCDIGSPLDDDFVAVIILSGLPQEYDPLIMALENNNTTLSSEIVKAKLLQEYQRRDDKETVSALVAKKTLKCFKCKKPGHVMKNCTQKFKKNKNETSNEKDSQCKSKVLISALSSNLRSDVWYVDSGATNHMCNNRSVMSDFNSKNVLKVSVANGDELLTAGQGNVTISLKDCKRTITNVYYVPKLSHNLLSVSELTRKGYNVTFDSKMCKIYDCNEILATATYTNGVYQLDTIGFALSCSTQSINNAESNVKPQCLTMTQGDDEECSYDSKQVTEKQPLDTQELWHRRLAHLNSRSMHLMKSGMVIGINYDNTHYKSCETCVKGKQTRLPFPKKSENRSKEILGLVHTDLCGPMQCASYGGCRYFLLFTDDFTRKSFVYFLKSKDEVFESFIKFKALVETQTGMKIKMLRSDNGLEYVNKKLQVYLEQHGIIHQKTVPYSPAQNGVSERANRTIVEKARCMLQDAGLDKRFWAEAVQTAVYIKNRTPTKAVMGATPEEKFTGKKVNVSHFKVFGCRAYALISKRKKLDPKSKQYTFIGYCEETKGYRLVDLSNPRAVVIARDVAFFENKFNKNDAITSHDDNVDLFSPNLLVENTKNCGEQPTGQLQSEPESFDDNQSQNGSDNTSLSDDDYNNKPKQRRQEIIQSNDTDLSNLTVESTDDVLDKTYVPGSSCYDSEETSTFFSQSDSDEYAGMAAMANFGNVDEPVTVKEALSSEDAKKWQDAMTDEYNSFCKNKCWTLTELKKGQKPVKCKWVFKIKRGLNGKILNYKARLVAKGYSQKYGIDYQETFAPVVRYSTIRMLFAIAAQLNLNIDQLDVKTAFLNGDLTEEVMMEQPEGFVIKGKENQVYRLNKSIYGLKQAAKCWYDKINEVLIRKMHFQKSSVEPCVYFRYENRQLTIIALYVDDILLFSSSNKIKKEVKDQLMKEYEMKDLGSVHEFLGMRVCTEKENVITLDQTDYIKSVLKRFQMEDCKPVSTPMEVGLKLHKEEKKTENLEYRNLIGCLMYIAVCTRPDIAHSVSFLSQFNDCYSDAHWKAAKRVLRYLKGTIDYRLMYEKSGLDVRGYVDADWASCEIDRKSYTGYVFKIGNSIVSWESRKQKTVALSSTEAEYMALANACKESLFIRTFLKECLNIDCVTTLFNDNQSALKLSENCMYHARTKHIDIRHHFIRDVVKNNLIKIEHLSTEDMTADLLTKPLSSVKFNKFVSQLNLKIS